MKRSQSRVCLVSHYYPPETGAAANRMQLFSRVLQKSFDQVDILTSQPNYPNPSLFEGNKKVWSKEVRGTLTIYRSWVCPVGGGSMFRRIANFLSFPFMSLRWLGVIWRHDLFVVTSGPMFAGLFIFLMSHFRKVTIVLDVRDLWPDRLWETGASNPPGFVKSILKSYERWMYSRCDTILAVTAAIQAELQERVGQEKKVVLIRNTDQTPASYGSSPGGEKTKNNKIIIVESGTQGWAQSPATLCEAAILLEDKYKGLFEVRFAGMGGKVVDIQAFEARSSCIRYCGNIATEKLDDFLRGADIGVASLMDTEHNKLAVSRRLYDYSRNGLAIVCAAQGEGADIIATTGAGVCVPPESPEDLARVLEGMIQNQEKLQLHKRNSAKLLSGEHSPQVIERMLEEAVVSAAASTQVAGF